MADTDNRDRTESPTQKRIEDARRRGQVPRSRDLTAAAVTLAGGLGLYGLGGLLGGRLFELMHSGLSLSAAQALGDDSMLRALGVAARSGALAAAPLLALVLAAAVLAPLPPRDEFDGMCAGLTQAGAWIVVRHHRRGQGQGRAAGAPLATT